MRKQFNPWWLLPIITLMVGLGVGRTIFTPNHLTPATSLGPLEQQASLVPSNDIAQEAAQKSAAKTIIDTTVKTKTKTKTKTKPKTNVNRLSEIKVVTVALPLPAVYQPQLNAKIVNNKVVVSKAGNDAPANNLPQRVNDDNSLLAKRFNQVLNDMEQEQKVGRPKAVLHSQPLTRYPMWYQELVPPLEFSEHVYSSKLNESRVRVNDQIVKEGELINDRMRIVKIEPQQVIIEMQQRQFSLPALSSW